jgi:PKD repeat protein
MYSPSKEVTLMSLKSPYKRLLTLRAVLLALTISSYLCPSARGQAAAQGQWSTLPDLMPLNPVHMALMNNGKVLIVSGSGNLPSNTSLAAAVWDPSTDAITTQPVAWDMFCNGMVILPDGRPFVVGGTLQYDPFFGEQKTSAYDPASGAFTDLQSMAHGRWYPTALTLGDGTVMTFSGLTETGDTNTAVEIYTPALGWSQEYVAPWTPPLYPRLHLLPNGTVFYSGSTTTSSIFDPSTHTWTTGVAQTNYSGTRTYGTSVLLPLTPQNGYKPIVMIMGGGDPATATTEIIDLSASPLQWVMGPSMSQPRVEMNGTILPNGVVLALGGSANDEDGSTASFNTDLYDPASNTFSTGAANQFPRLYHSNSLLLPDATVLVAGSNPARGIYEQHDEIYSPPYLFNPDGSAATRPAIAGVTPAALTYGGVFQLQTPDAADISSVVLMRPGASTHSFDMDQRMVGLSFTAGSGVLSVTAPPNGNIAPPGNYMVFILNSAETPSVATFVTLSASADTPPTATITSPSGNLTVNPGQSVFFAGEGSDATGSISSYSWTFPGGNPGSSSLATPGNVTYSAPGTYSASLTVQDTAGLTSQKPATRAITVSDFSISAAPASQLVLPGSSASYSTTLTAGPGFTGTVTFSISGLPSNTSATFSSNSVNGSGSTTMNVTTSLFTPLGSHQLTIIGNSGGLTHSATVTLSVGVPLSLP